MAPFLKPEIELHGIATDLLDAERDALLLDVNVEHLGFDDLALLVVLHRLLARTVPVEVGEVDHAVDIVLQPKEQAELGLVLDLALHLGADRMLLGELFPRIAHGLLQAKRDAALRGIDLEDHHFDFLRGRDDLAGVDVLFRPAHLGDVDQPFDARLEFHEGAVVGDVGHTAGEAGAYRILRLDAFPRI